MTQVGHDEAICVIYWHLIFPIHIWMKISAGIYLRKVCVQFVQRDLPKKTKNLDVGQHPLAHLGTQSYVINKEQCITIEKEQAINK